VQPIDLIYKIEKNNDGNPNIYTFHTFINKSPWKKIDSVLITYYVSIYIFLTLKKAGI